MVVHLDEDSFTVDTSLSFGASPSAGVYGQVHQAGSDIMCSQGVGPLSGWVNDHLFVCVPCRHLDEYNARHRKWAGDIVNRGVHQHGGHIWYSGHVFEDGTPFDEDCQFPCRDFSNHSPRSAEDHLFAYNFDNIDHISEQLGIPWDHTKDQPFGCMTTYIGFIWDLSSLQVSISSAEKEKYLCSIEE